jgi:hypothetical protein
VAVKDDLIGHLCCTGNNQQAIQGFKFPLLDTPAIATCFIEKLHKLDRLTQAVYCHIRIPQARQAKIRSQHRWEYCHLLTA